MSSHARLAPAASRKRKERENGSGAPASAKAELTGSQTAGNRLLAGYLAHEFLTKGTLIGRRWDPSPTELVGNPDHSRLDPVGAEPGPNKAAGPESAYGPVAYLLKADGAHVPGVFNPTQLARWLQM